MGVDGFDGQGAFEKDKFALEAHKELDAQVFFGCSFNRQLSMVRF